MKRSRSSTKSKSTNNRHHKANKAKALSRPLTGARNWAFRLTVVVLPFLALAVLELALRWGGYGYSTGFFKPLTIGDRPFFVENETFGFRFFPPEMARLPLSLRMPAHKSADTYRILILGESAAMGDPEPAFGAGRYLETLLHLRYPRTRFEVVNTGMTAINSHAILPIARDSTAHEGDLWILYIGNNEMVGPFGAATVFGPKAPPLGWVRFYLASQQLRMGQLAVAMKRKLAGDSQTRAWGGMKMFIDSQVAPDAPTREAVYRNFEGNLTDIVQTGLDSGAKLILCTVAVNLKDCPPFASHHATQTSIADCSAGDTRYRQGCEAADSGQLANAVQLFKQAAQYDPQMADVQYRWGEALLQLGDTKAAMEHLQIACDNDALPFRATSRINDIIKTVGQRFPSPNLDLLDANGILQTQTSTGICGRETFYEHVHLNFAGNYRLARAWAEEVAKALPASLRQDDTGDWASQDQCDERLAITDSDRYNVVDDLLGRRQHPPLSAQPNNAEFVQELKEEAEALQQSMTLLTARSNAQSRYLAALRLNPEDYYIQQNYAEFLQGTGATADAVTQWEQVRALIPQDHAAYYQLGHLAAAQGQIVAAQQLLAKTVSMRPSFAPGWFELGSIQAANGNYGQAITAFNHAVRLDPENGFYWFCNGLACAAAGQKSEAIAHYREAARLTPDDWRIHFELGGLLGERGDLAEARKESETSIRLNPDFPTGHLNLGLTLKALGDLSGAAREFEETLRLDPGNARATEFLAQVQNSQKQQE